VTNQYSHNTTGVDKTENWCQARAENAGA